MDIQLSTLTEAARQAAEACEYSLGKDVEAARERVLAYGRALLAIRQAIKSKKAYNAHLVEHRLDIRDSEFRSNTIWLAQYVLDLGKSPNKDASASDLGNSLSQCPYSNPGDIRKWLRKQERPEATVPNKPTQVGKTQKAVEARQAVRATMARGATLAVRELVKSTGLSRIVIEAAIAAEEARAEALREAAERTPVDVLALADAMGLGETTKAKLARLDAKLRKQHDLEFNHRVSMGVREHIDAYIMPVYGDKLAQAEMVLTQHYKPPFTDEEYRLLLSVLHPDAQNDARRVEAFQMIKKKEILLRADKDRKPLSSGLPTTIEELLAMRRGRRK